MSGNNWRARARRHLGNVLSGKCLVRETSVSPAYSSFTLQKPARQTVTYPGFHYGRYKFNSHSLRYQ